MLTQISILLLQMADNDEVPTTVAGTSKGKKGKAKRKRVPSSSESESDENVAKKRKKDKDWASNFEMMQMFFQIQQQQQQQWQQYQPVHSNNTEPVVQYVIQDQSVASKPDEITTEVTQETPVLTESHTNQQSAVQPEMCNRRNSREEDRQSVLSKGDSNITQNTECEEIDDEGENQMSFKQRVKRVREMLLGEENEPVIQDKTKTVLSVDPPKLTQRTVLPHSESFLGFFKNMDEEIKGVGRRRDNRLREPLTFGKLPKEIKPRMRVYTLKDCPWTHLPSKNPGLFQSSLFQEQVNRVSNVHIPLEKMEDFQNEQRNMLSIASYVDMFMWATKENVKETLKNLDTARYMDEPKLNFEEIQDVHENLEETLEFIQSAARGVQDMVQFTIFNIGATELWRKDSYIDKMVRELPIEIKNKLRQNGCNEDYLFDEGTLKEAKNVLSEEKREKVQEKYLATGNERRSERDDSYRGSYRGRGRGRGRGRPGTWNKQSDFPKHDFRKTRGGKQNNYRGGNSGNSGNTGNSV